MELFTDYIHKTENPQLADLISSTCIEHLNSSETDSRYTGNKTTFFSQNFLYDPLLVPLYNYIIKESINYAKVLGLDTEKISPTITALWISNTGVLGTHPYHTHSPGSHISGTFYVLPDEGSSPITFLSKHFYNDVWYNLPFINKNKYSATSQSIEPTKGKMLMWKSDLIHGVLTNNSNTRIAISFNLNWI
jgi:uncharacterized protein (TIGR02466 family)